jgi:hypothetical protein
MTDPTPTRKAWISLGEAIALAALVISGLGLWLTWKSSNEDRPTRVVEQRQAIPLTLRGDVEGDGRTLVIAPVEAGHALQSLSVTGKGAAPIELGSDGRLSSGDLERALGKEARDAKGTQSVPVRLQAHYVEAGADRRGGGQYRIRYRWEGGGLFGGRSLRLVGLSR